MNRVKQDQIYPEVLEVCDISSIWKLKGSRNNFDSYRGIFRVTIFRSILDRLIYNDEYSKIDENLTDSNVGARKGRNIRDNIFVMNAILNSVTKGDEEPVDIQIYDVEKCFDALWMQECINDIYEAGLDNDKLPLLFLENQNAKVAIKSSKGISKRVNITNIVMQGSVWGSLSCTTTMDKLGKIAYENADLLYMYKGLVAVPPICMVDDIMSIQKCSKATQINATINAFIEMKKLTLSEKKCGRIHVGRKLSSCHELSIHESKMKNSLKEKYLGDFVDSSGKIKATVQDRISKGYGILSEIRAIINEVPLGRHKLEIGLQLREAMLINGVLYNSEAWHSVTDQDILGLEKIDEALLRFLLGSHSKAPLEILYLESGAIPMRFILKSRRINYLQTIVKRDEEELTQRVFKAQLDKPIDGDFAQLVKLDCELIGLEFDLNIVKSAGADQFRKIVKTKIRQAALEYLKEKQLPHTKVQQIHYNNLETQPYLKSVLFNNDETRLLFSLRTRTSDSFKCNFRNLHGGKVECPLKCWGNEENPLEDSQQHLLECKKLKVINMNIASDKIVYNDLFGDVKRQKEAVTLFADLIEMKELEAKVPPGDKLDLSIGSNQCCRTAVFTDISCINCTSIRNK